MTAWEQKPNGRWLPAEPIPEDFGIVWERFWKFRRERGEWKWAALVRAFFDARAVAGDKP